MATHLGTAWQKAGYEIVQVYSRTPASALDLADRLGVGYTTSLEEICADADVYVVMLKDAVLQELIPNIVKGRNNALFVHTAGSMPMSAVLDVNAFDNLLNKPLSELSALFSALCAEHKEFVARYIFGLVDGAARAKKPIDNRISLALVRELNGKSKSEKYPEGMLARVEAIIKDNL